MRLFIPFLLLLLIISFPSPLTAQRNCGTMQYLEQQILNNPKQALKMQQVENATREFLSQGDARVVDGIITIPVVVHVVWNTAAENISDEQIQSQITILTEDFRRLNSDANNNWPQAADAEIEFCLAGSDPNGNTTNGITRTQTSVTSFSTNDNVKFDATGGKDAWPSSQYLNFWVCDLGGGLLGYAQFPGGPANTDGIVCDYQYVGNIGTATPPYHLGRTATHEVGHWLNLRHIWGDGGCGVDDLVADTPVSDAPNFSCPTGHVSCGSTDMIENYMDYTHDDCMNLLTLGQKDRMRALFEPGGFRHSLLSSPACGPVTPPTCDDGIQNGEETGIDCGGPNCPACPPCQDNVLTLTIVLDDYPEETYWVLNGDTGNTIASGGTYANYPDGATITDSICAPNGCYAFTIYDSFGDGICCQYGNGSYTLMDEQGNILASGGEFANSETTAFCIEGSIPGCTNPNAHNYNPDATEDDGSCETCSDGILNGDETSVDCGGALCDECACEEFGLTLFIQFDNYPEETYWLLQNIAGDTIASGGTYGDYPDGSTYSETFCLPEQCYRFTMFDIYADGLCCDYGPGYYTLTDDAGVVLAEGDRFGAFQTDHFCFGEDTLLVGCTNPYAHNYNPYAILDSGDCETCSDGEENGDETGIDCGGELCAPCTTDECTYEEFDFADFDSGWGIWNDGGSDCRRTSKDEAYSYSEPRCVRLRDNSSSSHTTTDPLDLSTYDELKVAFTFITHSMENGEDFWLQISTDEGESFETLATWARGTDFENDVRYFDTVTIAGPFTNATVLRFKCDASSNGDKVYLDDVLISGCDNGSGNRQEAGIAESVLPSEKQLIFIESLFPNPTDVSIHVRFSSSKKVEGVFEIYTLQGIKMDSYRVNMTGAPQKHSFEVEDYPAGLYLLYLRAGGEWEVRRFVVY